MDNSPDSRPVSVRVLVPDGGQLEEPEPQESEEAPEEEESEEDAAETEEDEAEGEAEERDQERVEDSADEEEGEEGEEGEGPDEEESMEEGEEGEEDADEADAIEADEAEDERSEKIADNGTRLLHLNLDGLFLDLLGLEVDLDEVTLNLTAVPNDGKLLGNLLSAVGGLLDGNPLSDLLDLGGGDGDSPLKGLLPSMPDMPDMPELNPMERVRGVASAIAKRLRELLGDLVSMLPLEELLRTFLQELVSQLLNGDNGNGNDNGDESAAGS